MTIAETTGRGSISRQDVAAVLVEVLNATGTAGRTFELIGGPTAIPTAVAAVS